MEKSFKYFASVIALGVEAAAVLIIALGALEAIYWILRSLVRGQMAPGTRRQIWVRFGVWLPLGPRI